MAFCDVCGQGFRTKKALWNHRSEKNHENYSRMKKNT